MSKVRFLFLASALILAMSCQKDEDEATTVPTSLLSISVDHEVDGDSVFFYNLAENRYQNAAGNYYEVIRLEYYLSDIKFMKSNGTWHSPSMTPQLINVENGTAAFNIDKVQIGDYQAVSIMIGIPASKNVTGMLENNLENLNMAWPESLGGGYHFMKFEGNYLDDQSIVRGFTVHLGNTDMQSVNEMTSNISISSKGSNQLHLSMNLNEWFESPHLYDFNIDGNYTMAVDSLMKKVSENGRNCLSIKN